MPQAHVHENKGKLLRSSIRKLRDRLRTLSEDASADITDLNWEIAEICLEDGCSQSALLEAFAKEHGGMGPSEYAGSMRKPDPAAAARDLHVFEMFETMRVGLGDKAWVAIAKRLRAEGHAAALVEMAIDHAIAVSEINHIK